MESQSKVKKCLERIELDFFEPVSSYKIIERGWTNLVIEINNRWIFRFVRDKDNRQIVLEGDFLPQFIQVCPIDIPKLVMSDTDYIAYPKIIGERFSPEKFLLFSDTQKTELIKLLAEFLTCLHDFQYDHPSLSDAPYGGRDFWNDLWFSVKDNLALETKTKMKTYFTKIFEQISAVPFQKTLIHADLGTNNVLVNFDRGSLGGVIDFGDLCLGDPAADFAGFYRNFGRRFTEELLNNYDRSIESNFWTRIEYESKRKMFFVVYFARNYGFESHVPNLLQYIENLF